MPQAKPRVLRGIVSLTIRNEWQVGQGGGVCMQGEESKEGEVVQRGKWRPGLPAAGGVSQSRSQAAAGSRTVRTVRYV